MNETSKFDVSKLSESELEEIQNEVMKAVTERALRTLASSGDVASLAAGHDSHGSVHSKHSMK